jgi:hypothetical protein
MSEATPTPSPTVGTPTRQPLVFLPHGGGPWPFIHTPMGGREGWAGMDRYMRALNMVSPAPPKALLVISAQ